MFRAVIFDMDGVLVNNHSVHLDAWEAFCSHHNLPFARESFAAKHFGKTNEDVLARLLPASLGKEHITLLGEEKEEIYRTLYKATIAPVKGLVTLLDELKEDGISMAVASSAPPSNINFVIDSLNIRKYFSVLINGSMVTHGKPNPEIYLKAAEELNILPKHCVVFEDSLSGIAAGQSAGMPVVALATTHCRAELPACSLTIDNFTEVNYRTLQQLMQIA